MDFEYLYMYMQLHTTMSFKQFLKLRFDVKFDIYVKLHLYISVIFSVVNT